MDVDHLIPDTLTLGATIYTIVLRNKAWCLEHECHGQCRWPDMEVDLVTEGQRPSEIANTLIHECLHLCYREWNIKARCGEERTVTSLGFALTSLFHQNPDLLVTIQALLELNNAEES